MINFPSQPDPKIAAIVKALALTENGGKVPDEAKAGQSGEMKSIFQYTPGTWKMYSKEVLGKEVPLDRGSETLVTYGKVHDWTEQGLSPDEIASIWNSGKPDSYRQDKVGVNKYGVKYDVPGYVKKFNEHLKVAEGDTNKNPSVPSVQSPPQSAQSAQPMAQSPVPPQSSPPIVQAPQTNTLPQLMQRNMKQVRQV